MTSKILIIDDEKDICFLISEIIQEEKFITESSMNSIDALNKFNEFKPDLVILDVWLGNSELDGIELLKEFKQINPSIPVIIISGHGTVDMAVNAIKNGAYDFIEKPFTSEKIIILTKRALESAKLINENELLKKIADPYTPIIGNSSFIVELKKNLKKISESKSRVLITGPKGSGKKLIAQNIHKYTTNNNSLPKIIDFKNLNEFELTALFPDEKDTFNKNLFNHSNIDTFILSNIDYLPVYFQKKLLIYLKNENLFNKLNIKLDIKIIAITSANIENEIKKGNFIRSLYDRINVVRINVPPISNRRKDIIPICNYYLNHFNKNKKFNFHLSKNATDQLELYNWPGNVRQIINYIEKTIIVNQDLNLHSNYEIIDLPKDMNENQDSNIEKFHFTLSLKKARNNFEKEYLLSQIERFDGNIMKISEFTGMERTALYRKFKSLNITIEKK